MPLTTTPINDERSILFETIVPLFRYFDRITKTMPFAGMFYLMFDYYLNKLTLSL